MIGRWGKKGNTKVVADKSEQVVGRCHFMTNIALKCWHLHQLPDVQVQILNNVRMVKVKQRSRFPTINVC